MQGTFVLSTYRKKDPEQIRKVNYRQTKMRYVVLVIAIFVVFGCEYCFDTPSALQIQIERNYQEANQEVIKQSEFNLLYSLYAFPNIIIPLLGGILIDKFGARIVLVLTASFCVLGQFVFSMGGMENLFSVMLMGRIIFGVGGEVLHASQNTIISNWFKASQLSMALGICISFPKLGSSLNAILSPTVSKKYEKDQYMNVGAPLFLGLIFMVVSLVLAVVLALIDRKSQKNQKIVHQSALLSGNDSKLEEKLKRKKEINKTNSNSQIKSVHISQRSMVSKIEKHQQGQGHLNVKQIKNLPLTFWLLIFISMISQALFIPFLDNGNKYYTVVFKGIDNAQQAGFYLILPYLVSSILVVPMGYIVDKVGRRSIVIIISTGFIFLTYCFMMILETSQYLRAQQWVRYLPSGLLGVCVAIFCTVIVPTVPMLVKPSLLGTGFGIMQMLQNLALGAFPLIAGLIRQTQKRQIEGFHLQTLFFFLMSCICFGSSFFLKAVDLVTGNKLDQKNFRTQYVNKVLKEGDD